VIVLSAYNNFEYARTALKYGAENYLLKPIDSDELSDTISQIAGHIQEREQLNSTYGQAMLTFRNAFTIGEFGYGCASAIILVLQCLLATVIINKIFSSREDNL